MVLNKWVSGQLPVNQRRINPDNTHCVDTCKYISEKLLYTKVKKDHLLFLILKSKFISRLQKLRIR